VNHRFGFLGNSLRKRKDMMRIAIGCDHRGFELKQVVMEKLAVTGHDYEDFGTGITESADYPDYARKVARAVAGGGFERGILICGTGIGMSIAANKVRGIRAALCSNVLDAERARQHNDAQVLCLSAATEPDLVWEMIQAFLSVRFEAGGRHERRVEKIKQIETEAK
jgi:ribose 5-phosphate isomerase B